MPGVQDFTYANWGKETVRGTPVAPTRQFYGEGTGVLDVDPSLSFHEAENRGRRGLIARATQRAEDTSLTLRDADGIGFDDLVWPLTQLKGGLTGTGAGADKTWAGAPAMTGNNNQESMSVDVGDDVQNWRVQYAMMKRWRLSAAKGELTRFEADLFGQRAVKVAKATPASNLSPKIPGDLWQIKYAGTFAGLGGASVQLNHLLSWSCDVTTGLIWRHYQDGNLFGSQHVETAIGGQLKLRVESTALAVSEFYDKWLTQTPDYVRLRAVGPALGGSNYSMQLDLPVLWSKVKPIDEQEDGVNIYGIEANLLDDGTNAISPTLVCSLAAIP